MSPAAEKTVAFGVVRGVAHLEMQRLATPRMCRDHRIVEFDAKSRCGGWNDVSILPLQWCFQLKTPLQWEDGYIIPPTAPGLGIELDDSVVAAHPWRGETLHLEMGDTPHDPKRHGLFGGG